MDEIRKISTDNFKIEDNLISFSDSVIQISNISQVDVAPPPKKQFNMGSIGAIVVGLLIMMIVPGVQTLGVLIAGCGVIYVMLYMSTYSNEKIYLNISLNSGRVYSMICKDTEFLKQVLQVIKYCINHHSTQLVQIDFDNCKMYNSPVIVGNDNEVG